MSLYVVKSADGFASIAVKSIESLSTELMVASSEKKNSTTTRKELKMASENETIADIVREMRIGDLCASDVAARTMYINDFLASYADRIEEAWKREVAELRKCLKEAIREKCPFTRMSCKHGEPCDYECETDKWRKALGEEGGAK